MINMGARDRGQLQGLLRSVREAQDAYVQRIPQRVRHVDAATGRRSGELFDEVRNAPRCAGRPDRSLTLFGGRSINRVSSSGDLGALQAGYIDAYGARKRPTSARNGRNGMSAGEFIGAVRRG